MWKNKRVAEAVKAKWKIAYEKKKKKDPREMNPSPLPDCITRPQGTETISRQFQFKFKLATCPRFHEADRIWEHRPWEKVTDKRPRAHMNTVTGSYLRFKLLL